MDSDNYTLVRLANGAFSVHSVADRETFHPVIGPVAEARALYVDQVRLRERLGRQEGEFVLWDVGLGAGANVLTALEAAAETDSKLHVLSFDHTFEPLRFALQNGPALGYIEKWREPIEAVLKDGHAEFRRAGLSVRWELRAGDFPTFIRRPANAPAPHVIMFDAYSPARNPAMWTASVFADLFRALDPARPCAMPTYSRSTMLRVTLLLAGFYVGVGHPTGEKEVTTIASNTPALIDEPLPKKWLLRARVSKSAEPLHEPAYRQAPLTQETWERLQQHPQFA